MGIISKKYITLNLFVIVYLAFPELLLAAPSNGTILLPNGRAEVGYEYNVMFKRPLDRSYGNLKTQNHFYIVSLGVFDWLSLDGKIGFGDLRLKDSSHLPKLEFDTGFAGGYGFRIKAFEHTKLGVRVTLGAQHISVHPRDRSADDDKYESFLDDWQISGLVSKSFEFLTPYIGIKGSDCEFVYKINKHDRKRRYSDYHLGLVFGSDLCFFDNKLRINIETRFFDETALSTAVTYMF